jgi:hypothetical protein
MSRIAHFAMAAAIAVGSLFSTPDFSRAGNFFLLEQPVFVSQCASPRYLSRISYRFRYQVRHVPFLPNVTITNFYDIHETRYLPVVARHPISRLYCAAKATLSDGDVRDVWYVIEGRMGFASIGDNVEFCVSGYDRWMVYSGNCQVLR